MIINSDVSLQTVIGELRDLFHRHKYLKLSVKSGKARSLDQNAISHAWYEQLARELREDDALGHKRFCKLHFGVPILIAEDDEFRDFYQLAIRRNLTYEQKLKAMSFMPVTSLMTKSQLSAYLDDMRQHFLTKGVILDFPETEA